MSEGNDQELHILALEPWLGGSHLQFLEQWREHSRHRVEILGLPARHWRWRMRSSAWQFARDLADRKLPNALWVSDYVDLPTLLGLLPAAWQELPITAYFHENQATYPVSENVTEPERERDHHLAWTNALTALRADRVVFNSEFHLREFERGFDELCRIWPKPNPRLELERALAKAEVISPGVRVSEIPLGAGAPTDSPLRVLFNQRWEHDKNPTTFFDALRLLRGSGVSFKLHVLGERYTKCPACFDLAETEFADQISHWGFADQRSQYEQILQHSDVVVSTALHEFFGLAVVEATSAGCIPLVPDALAYPEVFAGMTGIFHRNTPEDLAARLGVLAAPSVRASIQQSLTDHARRYSWQKVAKSLDEHILLTFVNT